MSGDRPGVEWRHPKRLAVAVTVMAAALTIGVWFVIDSVLAWIP